MLRDSRRMLQNAHVSASSHCSRRSSSTLSSKLHFREVQWKCHFAASTVVPVIFKYFVKSCICLDFPSSSGLHLKIPLIVAFLSSCCQLSLKSCATMTLSVCVSRPPYASSLTPLVLNVVRIQTIHGLPDASECSSIYFFTIW